MKKKKRIPRIIDFTSLSDLFMLLSVLFLVMYSINNLKSLVISMTEREKARRAVSDVESTASLLRANFPDLANKSHIRQKIRKIQDLELKAEKVRLEQKKLYDIALDREINLKEYRKLIENSIYGRNIMEAEVRMEKKANDALLFQNKILSRELKNLASKRDEKTNIIHGLKEILTQKDNALMENSRSLATLNRKISDLEMSNRSKDLDFLKTRGESQKIKKELEDFKRVNQLQSREMASVSNDYQSLFGELLQVNKKYQQQSERLEELVSQNKSIFVECKKEVEKNELLKASTIQLEQELSKNKKEVELARRKLAFSEKEKEILSQKQQILLILISKIENSLKSSKVADWTIDRKTGDVYLALNKFYFPYGQDSLTPDMKSLLEEFIKAYAAAIHEDPIIAQNIKTIYLVGSASPTFNKKIINQKNFESDWGKRAVSFNLDLSYRRARNIFNHLFNNAKFDFPYRKEMLSHIKVSGSGFLGTRLLAQVDENDSCEKINCDKFQNVKIGFTLK